MAEEKKVMEEACDCGHDHSKHEHHDHSDCGHDYKQAHTHTHEHVHDENCNHDHQEEHVHDENCGCGCNDEVNEKAILVEFLFLDLVNCKRCIETKKVLFEAIEELKGPLSLAGYTFDVQGIKIDSKELAKEFEFEISPTVLVEFQDILGGIVKTACQSCTDAYGVDTACRAYVYDNLVYEVPSKGMVIEGILKAVFGNAKILDNDDYKVPDDVLAYLEKNK